MSKKDFSGALRRTATEQKTAIEDRFARADSVLLAKSPSTEPAAAPAPATKAQAPEKKAPTTVPPVAPPVEAPTEAGASEFVIRDTFSMPQPDHAVIDTLRTRAAREGRITNKSEVVRAALRLMETLPAAELVAHLDTLQRVKPGRK